MFGDIFSGGQRGRSQVFRGADLRYELAGVARELVERLRIEDNARARLTKSMLVAARPMEVTVWATTRAPKAGPIAAPKFAAAPLSAVERPDRSETRPERVSGWLADTVVGIDR
jgi:hypothetical protein